LPQAQRAQQKKQTQECDAQHQRSMLRQLPKRMVLLVHLQPPKETRILF
jgi:hypothetical protein